MYYTPIAKGPNKVDIQRINSINYNNKSSNFVNFKSKIVNTRYINDLLEKGIKEPAEFNKIIEYFYGILNDGKNNIVKISYYKNKFWQFIIPGAYTIKINNNKPDSNCHFCGRGIEIQGLFALKEAYKKSVDSNTHIENNITETTKIAMYQKRIQTNWEKIFQELDNDNSKKRIRNLHKNIDFLTQKFNEEIRKELIILKKNIFEDNKIID